MRSEDRLRRAAVALAGLVFLLAASAAVAQLAWSDRIERADGCGFDGFYYCAMLRDEVVPKPFSQRILLPFLVERISETGLTGFWVVNVLSLIGATLIAVYCALRLGWRRASRGPVAYVLVPPLLVGAAFLASRNTFHLIATYPALSDPLALLLLMAAVALVATPAHPSTRLLLIPVCFLAPLAREALAPVLILALVVAGVMRMLPWHLVVPSAIASGVGGVFALSRPNAGAGNCLTPDGSIEPCPDSVADTIGFWLDWDFGSWEGFLRFVVMLLLAVGPFVLALVPTRRRLWEMRSALWIAAVAAIFTAVTVFGGGDTDRILTPAGLLLALALAVAGARNAPALLGLSVVVAAYAVQQTPWSAVDGDPNRWLEFYGLRVTTNEAVVDNGLVPTLIALPIALIGVLLLRLAGSQPTRAAGVARPCNRVESADEPKMTAGSA
jgi:hypothetical protein